MAKCRILVWEPGDGLGEVCSPQVGSCQVATRNSQQNHSGLPGSPGKGVLTLARKQTPERDHPPQWRPYDSTPARDLDAALSAKLTSVSRVAGAGPMKRYPMPWMQAIQQGDLALSPSFWRSLWTYFFTRP